MRIGRLDIGLWQYPPDSPYLWYQRYFEISYDRGLCGCHIFTISKFCITWLGDECLKPLREDSEHK